MQKRLEIMLEMQEVMNIRVHPDWRSQGFQWYRAIWVECAELLDHYGWKWWKKQDPDMEQVKLELVDIWHFGMSQLLLNETNHERLSNHLAAELLNTKKAQDFREDLEVFALDTLRSRVFDVGKFGLLLAGAGLGFDELYRRYIGKNVLNFFRQDHGYQDGSYHKDWAGREDNEHLVELALDLDANDPDFKDNLYAALAQRYQASVA